MTMIPWGKNKAKCSNGILNTCRCFDLSKPQPSTCAYCTEIQDILDELRNKENNKNL